MSADADIAGLNTQARCFRLRRYYLYLGIVSGVFFAVMGVISTLAALWNVGWFPRPKLFAVVFGAVWSGFTLLALWIIAAYWRERLFFGGDAIVQHGIFRCRTVKTREVVLVKWRARPTG